MDRHMTSVFSEYESADNNSFNSRQLEFWLKEIASPAPGTCKKPTGFEWTFMSNASSSYEPDDVSFARHTENSSEYNLQKQKNKENSSLMSNHMERIEQHRRNEYRNQSCVNAMLALQKRVKTLEEQNQCQSKKIIRMSQQRNRSMSESFQHQEALKSRLEILEPQSSKYQQLIQENKRLRELKEERARKSRLSQKNLQQCKQKYEVLTVKYSQLSKENDTLKQKLEQTTAQTQLCQKQMKRLIQKNKQLEAMKEQSTMNLLDKYNKSVEMTEQYERQVNKLRNQLYHVKQNSKQSLESLNEKYKEELKASQIAYEKLKQNCRLKDSSIQETKSQIRYFKQAYEKKDGEYHDVVRNYHVLQEKQESILRDLKQSKLRKRQQEELHEQRKQELEQLRNRQQSARKQIEKIREERSEQSDRKQQSQVIMLPQTLIPDPNHTKFLSQEECQEQSLEQQYDQIPRISQITNKNFIPSTQLISKQIQTKSLGKQSKQAQTHRKIQRQPQKPQKKQKISKNKTNSQKREISVKSEISPIAEDTDKKERAVRNRKPIKQMNHTEGIIQHKQGKKQKVQHSSSSQEKKKKTPKPSNRRNLPERAPNAMSESDVHHSHPNYHRITFEGGCESVCYEPEQAESCIRSAPYYHRHANNNLSGTEIHEFQQPSHSYNIHLNSFKRALIYQLKTQTLQLYNQQQNLMTMTNSEYLTPQQRLEYHGRLKQLNEQLKNKNQKIIELQYSQL